VRVKSEEMNALFAELTLFDEPGQISFLVFDSSNAVLCGVIRGCGQQRVGFVVSMVLHPTPDRPH
jgi:hypothetical protein